MASASRRANTSMRAMSPPNGRALDLPKALRAPPLAAMLAHLADEGLGRARMVRVAPGREDHAPRQGRIDRAAREPSGLAIAGDVRTRDHVRQEGDAPPRLDHPR